MSHLSNKFPSVTLGLLITLAAFPALGAERVTSGLEVLYDFRTSDGDWIKDQSGNGGELDLRIENPKAVRKTSGSLEVVGKTLIRSEKPAAKLIEAVKRSGELTLEAWIRPSKNDQSGPARILTLSRDSGQRNFTLGQEGDRFDVRLRTTKTSGNGIPSLSTGGKSLETKLTHVVYTRDRSGRTRVYLNGKRSAEDTVGGDTSNWDPSFRLALANELSQDRPWLGTYHLVAVYSQCLRPEEVEQNFRAGTHAAHASPLLAEPSSTSATRVHSGLQVLYDFQASDGGVVADRSGTGQPLNLRVENPKNVRRTDGALEVTGDTVIRSESPAGRITSAIRATDMFTLEAWVRPSRLDQSGPARLVTLSQDSGERNFTLGQANDLFEVRFRTTTTSANGAPALTSKKGSVTTDLTHVVYTRNRAGRARLYLNGELNAELTVPGDTSNWKESYRLGLANELSQDRPWRGAFHLVAIYNRDLSPGEVEQNHRAGPRAAMGPAVWARNENALQASLFHNEIAPILARHCLECHDTATRKGKLDLSRREAALQGSSSGVVLVPGKLDESFLWETVQSDEMPADRTPLSDREKELLKQWIEEGAHWATDVIDPVIYQHGSEAAQNWLRRLTIPEYIETVRGAVGVDISKEARELLPPDLRADGFNNTAYNLNVDLGHVQAYARLAEMVVGKMDPGAFAKRFGNSRLSTDDNMRDLVARMGKWILRGPLEEHEVNVYCGISTTVASAGGGFDDAVGYILEAMLQSPRFLYRMENQLGDGSAWPVGDFELASRMSYIIWGGPPDQELMRAAEAGELYDQRRVESHLHRMLQDPRAVERSSQFLAQWLNLNHLNNLAPSPERFPNWDAQLAADMREESLAYFEEIAWKQNRPLSDLLNAQVTFVTPRLARHYGLEVKGDKPAKVDVSSVPGRGGLLTQGSVLTVGGDEASMVTRGLFVLHDVLRGAVKDPPPCVDTTPVSTKPGLTQRAIAEDRIANPSCGGCHSKFEPLAFGLEKFDGIGAYHEKDEHGNPLRDDGKILFPGEAEPVSYKNSAELMDLLAQSERVRETLTWKVAQFALGRPLVAHDVPILDKIHESAQKNGGTYPSVITAIVMSDLVQKTRTETRP